MYEFLDWQVRDVMSKPVTITPETSIQEVEKLLETRGFNALPVVDASQALLGVVTSLDLLAAFRFGEASLLPPYSQIMKRPPLDWQCGGESREPARATPPRRGRRRRVGAAGVDAHTIARLWCPVWTLPPNWAGGLRYEARCRDVRRSWA